MKFIDDISLRETELGLVMLYHKSEGTLFELNETASIIAKEIAANKDVKVSDIAEKMIEMYDAEKTVITEEIQNTIEEFVEYGILVK